MVKDAFIYIKDCNILFIYIQGTARNRDYICVPNDICDSKEVLAGHWGPKGDNNGNEDTESGTSSGSKKGMFNVSFHFNRLL